MSTTDARGVNPARAGMIRDDGGGRLVRVRKPRASGDDPEGGVGHVCMVT